MRNYILVHFLLFFLSLIVSPVLCAFIPVSRSLSSSSKFPHFRPTSVHTATLGECEQCSSSTQCSTGLCSSSRCIFDNVSSIEKCFSSLGDSNNSNSDSNSHNSPTSTTNVDTTPPRHDECNTCSADNGCASNFCFNGKCIDLSTESLSRCFAAECAACSSSADCETELCENGVCVFDSKASRSLCAVSAAAGNPIVVGNPTNSHGNTTGNSNNVELVPPVLTSTPTPTVTLCAGCSKDYDCTGITDGFCYNSKCTDGSDTSLDMCFKPECSLCIVSSDCITQLCDTAIGLCVFNTSDSKEDCLKQQAERTPSSSPIPTPTYSSTSVPTVSSSPIPSTATTVVSSPATTTTPMLIITATPSGSATSTVRGECATCSNNGECGRERLCYNAKCVDGSNGSLNRCFQGECAFCLSSTDCVTKFCENSICVFDSDGSRNKCASSSSASPFASASPSASSSSSPSLTQTSPLIISASTSPFTTSTGTTNDLVVDECTSCTDDSDCSGGSTGVCFNGRCTDGGDAAKLRCFEDECGPCESSADCASELCNDSGQCVFDTDESRNKCTLQQEQDENEDDGDSSELIDSTSDKKQECALCLDDSECANGSCLNRKCSDGSEASLQRCFLPECAVCKSSRDCATGYCDIDVVRSNDDDDDDNGQTTGDGKCTLGTTKSQDLCRAKLRECARCRFNSQCAVGKCWGARCTDASSASLNRCFKKECSKCTSHFQCSTKHCGGGRCIFKDSRESSVKCFGSEGTKKECEACEGDNECMQGVCWRKKCTNGAFSSKARCFTKDCEACSRSRECHSAACVRGKCADRRTKTTEKCQ